MFPSARMVTPSLSNLLLLSNWSDPRILMKDDTQTAQIRRTILQKIEEMDIELLKRIAYECRCEEMGIWPDMTYVQW